MFAPSESQASRMLDLQYEMNKKIDPCWVTAGHAWHRAVVAEGSEALDHGAWKWWKHQERNIPQLQLELVDIWHFILSDFIVRCEGNLETAKMSILAECVGHQGRILFDGKTYAIDSLDLLEKLELQVGLAVSRRTSMYLFRALMTECGMNWTDLTRQYFAKNVLNTFRQNNGYKGGTYVKVWEGREDNEHLAELVLTLDPDDPDFSYKLYCALEDRYPASKALSQAV